MSTEEARLNELSLFSGIGGGLLATRLFRFRVVGYVERDDYRQRTIAARIADGLLDPAPIFGDIETFLSQGFAGRYRGVAQVITAGFVCTPYSIAGKQKADADENNTWPATRRVIELVRPPLVFLENVPNLLTVQAGDGRPYGGVILGDLAALGYDCRWCCLSASEVGAPHPRDRLWIMADLDEGLSLAAWALRSSRGKF